VPDYIFEITDGPEAKMNGKQLFLDIHHLEPGSVTAEAVAGAHAKDLTFLLTSQQPADGALVPESCVAESFFTMLLFLIYES
jgi:hypothetical protein